MGYPRRFLAAPLLVTALIATGCGSTDRPTSTDRGVAVKAAPGAPLRVTVTDGRVGDATTAARGSGLEELSIGGRRFDPADRRRDGVGAGDACADADLAPTAENLPAVSAATLCLLNGQRADAGLAALTDNPLLAQAATAHARDMIANNFFAHVALDGSDVVSRVQGTGYIPTDRRWIVGENLAWGTGVMATPRSIVGAWMESQGHRENILRADYREIGFGVVTGNPRLVEGEGATYVTNFGAVSGAEQSEPATTAAAPKKSSTRKARHRRSRAARRGRARARAYRARARVARGVSRVRAHRALARAAGRRF